MTCRCSFLTCLENLFENVIYGSVRRELRRPCYGSARVDPYTGIAKRLGNVQTNANGFAGRDLEDAGALRAQRLGDTKNTALGLSLTAASLPGGYK